MYAESNETSFRGGEEEEKRERRGRRAAIGSAVEWFSAPEELVELVADAAHDERPVERERAVDLHEARAARGSARTRPRRRPRRPLRRSARGRPSACDANVDAE